MKRLASMMAIAIALLACSANVTAQDKGKNKQRMSREQLAEAQAKHIAHELAFDDATTAKFTETFCNCQKEIWALGPRQKPKKQADMTEAESEQAIKSRFEHSQKILTIREKYYKEYSKFLTQKQIQRVYDLEQKSMKRLAKRDHQKPKPGKKRFQPNQMNPRPKKDGPKNDGLKKP